MSCKYSLDCNFYSPDSFTCNSNKDDSEYCGIYRKLESGNNFNVLKILKSGLEKVINVNKN